MGVQPLAGTQAIVIRESILSPVSTFSAIDSLKDTSLHLLAVPLMIHLRTYFDLRDPISEPVRVIRKYAEVEDGTN